MYKQLHSQKRLQIFALLQKNVEKRYRPHRRAQWVNGLQRESERSSTDKAHCLWSKVYEKAMAPKKRMHTQEVCTGDK